MLVRGEMERRGGIRRLLGFGVGATDFSRMDWPGEAYLGQGKGEASEGGNGSQVEAHCGRWGLLESIIECAVLSWLEEESDQVLDGLSAITWSNADNCPLYRQRRRNLCTKHMTP